MGKHSVDRGPVVWWKMAGSNWMRTPQDRDGWRSFIFMVKLIMMVMMMTILLVKYESREMNLIEHILHPSCAERAVIYKQEDLIMASANGVTVMLLQTNGFNGCVLSSKSGSPNRKKYLTNRSHKWTTFATIHRKRLKVPQYRKYIRSRRQQLQESKRYPIRWKGC